MKKKQEENKFVCQVSSFQNWEKRQWYLAKTEDNHLYVLHRSPTMKEIEYHTVPMDHRL